MAEFDNLLKSSFGKDIRELGLKPKSPLDFRLRRVINFLETGSYRSELILNGYDISIHALAELVKPLAISLIQTPLSFTEYKNRKRKAFIELAKLSNDDSNDKESPNGISYFLRIKLLTAALISTGYLSRKEAEKASSGGWDYFENHQEIKQAAGDLNHAELTPIAQDLKLNQLAKQIQDNWKQFKISAIIMGVFDLDHLGHKKIISDAKQLLGDDGRLYVLTTDTKTSMLTKSRNPSREQGERTGNVSFIKGTDGVCSVTLPEGVLKLEEAEKFYNLLHSNLQPQIRIIGNPARESKTSWEIYRKQCLDNDILILYPDDYIEESTTRELESIRNS